MEQRFTIRNFTSLASAEEWLNSLDEQYVVRAATDTPDYFTLVVENTNRELIVDMNAVADDALELEAA